MKFKSKVDWWFNAIMLLISALSIYLMVSAALTKSQEQLLSAIIMLAIVVLLILPIYFFTYYEIRDEALIIKSGYFYKKKIMIKDIVGIAPTNNPLSSAALSINRIAIVYNNGKRITNEFISPQYKDEFISALKKINPEINVKTA